MNLEFTKAVSEEIIQPRFASPFPPQDPDVGADFFCPDVNLSLPSDLYTKLLEWMKENYEGS